MNGGAAYDGAAWAGGPALVYDRLAQVLVEATPAPLGGRRVLDVGAGAGAVSKAVVAARGRPVAADLSFAMLAHDRPLRPPAAVADAARLPFSTGVFGATVAAFLVNHAPDPARVLGEAARVTEHAGPVLASVFSSRNSHPSKAQVDEVAARFGFRVPAWFRRFKDEIEPLTATPALLAATARSAGLADIVVTERAVDVGVRTAADLVAWRLGMAHLAPFVATLEPDRRRLLVTQAEAAVGPDPQPYRPVVLILAGRSPFTAG